MAESNFWARMANLWGGFVSLWIADVEKNHPEIAYENAINGMATKYIRLKTATAAIIRRRDEINHRFDSATADLERVKADLNAALATNQDDLALVLIEKKNVLEESLKEVNAEMAQAKGDADDAKASLVSVKNEIAKLKAEKDRMLAKMQSAEARLKIQEQIEGISVDAEVQALENVREHIKTRVAEASLGKELADSDLDSRLKKLREQSGTISARSELDALKAARAQASTAAPRKM
jgi:phage shock protein A